MMFLPIGWRSFVRFCRCFVVRIPTTCGVWNSNDVELLISILYFGLIVILLTTYVIIGIASLTLSPDTITDTAFSPGP